MIINSIPNGLRRLIPLPLKRLLVRGYLRLWLIKRPRDLDTPRINFAGVLPTPGKFVRGGKVKLTYLRDRWGEYHQNFNIIYLVSSALPPYPDIWIDEARRKGVKVVWNQNGIGVPAWAPEKWREINDSMRPLAKADYVAYQSRFAQSEADDLVARAQGPHSVVTNSCDTTLFHPALVPPPPKPFRLMVMGTAMTAEKVMIPLEALKILTERGFEAELRNYGPVDWPRAEEEIANKIMAWGLQGKVIRRGRYPHTEAPSLYREGHVYIHTKHMDSSPSAILEAMATGLPVVAGSTGGPAEWVPPTAGVIIPVTYDRERFHYPTAREVADAVEEIAANWERFSRGARENAVQYFGNDLWLKKHEDIFRTIGIKRV